MLTQAQINFLKKYLNKITWHWSAGTYSWTSPKYHFNITYDGKLAHSKQTRSLYEIGEHVYKRNTGNIGITMCGMYVNPKTKQTDYPIQQHQLEVTAKLTAELMLLFDIDIKDVQDHKYWATMDGYGPGSGHPETRTDVGSLEPQLRSKTLWYLQQLKSGKAKREFTLNLK